LLADLIEHIDNNQLGTSSASHNRTTYNLVSRIRERSTQELADLARVATPLEEDALIGITTAPQLSEFHCAINEAIILTEPWTVILIRAFSKAATYLLNEANNLLLFDLGAFGGNSSELEQKLRGAEDCIKGLWLLGKKSDIARKVADVLSAGKSKLKA
jgi:hypothetical protein